MRAAEEGSKRGLRMANTQSASDKRAARMVLSEERAAKCYLVLDDGTVFPGTSFGAHKEIDGEIGE